MSNAPYLSVIIPSYNEQRNLDRGVLTSVQKFLKSRPYTWEIILSDDGSIDKTLVELTSFASTSDNITVLQNEHRGKGPTVQSGMLAARGEWRLFTDFDQSTPIEDVEKLLTFGKQGFDVIIGSREITGAHRDHEPIHRHLMGRGFNMFVKTLAIPDIQDTQCGFKLFSAKATKALFPKLYVYGSQAKRSDAFTGAFDVEVLYLAKKYGFTMKEVAIQWQHNETDRVSPVKDSLRMLRDIVRVRMADLQGKYTKSLQYETP